jgi:hypothetical protein
MVLDLMHVKGAQVRYFVLDLLCDPCKRKDMSTLDSLGASPNPVEIASVPADFQADFKDANQKPWGGVRALKVTGAGTVTVRLVSPRYGSATETFTMAADEVLPGQIAEITAVSGAVLPIKVWR